MKNINVLSVVLILSIVLAGCANGPQYRAAKNGGNGYSDIKVSDDRYRVQYTSNREDVLSVTNHALFRSAQLTQQQGFDWFVVTSRETFVDRKQVQPDAGISFMLSQASTRECGLLTCTQRHQPIDEMGLELANNRERTEVQSILEVRMGKGMQVNEDSYAVVDVLQNLQPN